jgi:ABC-type multidrug transport system fused ATPase/permease subunit
VPRLKTLASRVGGESGKIGSGQGLLSEFPAKFSGQVVWASFLARLSGQVVWPRGFFCQGAPVQSPVAAKAEAVQPAINAGNTLGVHMGAYGRLLKYVTEIKLEIAGKVGLGLLISASYIIQAMAMAKTVSTVFKRAPFEEYAWYLVAAAAMVAVRGFLVRYNDIYSKIMAARVKTKFRLFVFDKILRLGPGYLNDKRSGRIQSLVLDGIESLEPFLVNYVPQIITITISGLAIGIYLSSLDALTGAVAIVSMVLCVGVPYLTVPFVSRSIVSYWRSYARLNSQYVDAMQGLSTLKAFNANLEKGKELAGNAWDFYRKALISTTFSLIDSWLMNLLTAVASLVTVALAAYRTDMGLIEVTAVSVFLFLATECARPMVDLNMYWHNSFLGLSVAEELFAIADEEILTVEPSHPNTESLDLGLPIVELKSVSFSYGGSRDVPVLDQVSLKIGQGQKAAIVGRSGAGKSTIVSLLLRFYDVTDGSVTYNGIDIKDYSIDYLQSKIAVVFQETYLFEGTILDNIRMAKPEANEDEAIEAAKAANAHSFIVNMPNGYQTLLGERGARLSGGERQRLAIARAFLKNSSFLILDEATSSVDAKSEALIQEALDRLAKNRTTLIIAHRLSTIKNADVIFVLESGRLAESGTHEQLLAQKGIYHKLINAQTTEGLPLDDGPAIPTTTDGPVDITI